MPRIRYALFPRGLHLNHDNTLTPEGALRYARNVHSLAGEGYLRSAPPSTTSFVNNTRGKAYFRFNGRFIARGEVAAVQRYERQGVGDAFALLDHTTLTVPAVTLLSSSLPSMFLTAPPTPEKDEYLFMAEPTQVAGNNALLKLSEAGVLSHWGILPPSAAYVATVTAVPNAQSQKYINTAATDPIEGVAGTTDWTMTSGDDNDDALTAYAASEYRAAPAIDGNSLRVRAGKDDMVVLTKTFGAPVDLTTFGGGIGSTDHDFVQVFVRIRRPKHLENIEIAFDTTDGTFNQNFYKREVAFKLVGRRKRRQLIGLGDLVPLRQGGKVVDVQKYLQENREKLDDLTHSEEMGVQRLPVTKNSWTRLTLPKASFEKSGTPNWATVRAIRLTVHANKEGRTIVFFDSLKIVGGTGMHGDYQYAITFSSENGAVTSAGSRSNPAIDNEDGTVTGIPNDLVRIRVTDGTGAPTSVERQSVRLTFPALSFDPQVTRLEIWRTVGNGAAFFRCGYINVSGGAIGAGTTFDDTAADYYGLNSGAARTTVGNNVSFAVLEPDVELPLDNASPNDPAFAFQRVANQTHLARMWWGRNVAEVNSAGVAQTSTGNLGKVYYSPAGRCEAVQGFVTVTSGITDPVTALVVWNDRLYVFTTSSLWEIVGTDEPFVVQKIEGVPGCTKAFTVQATAIGIMWVGEDGVYKFNGQYGENITDKSLLPIFRHRLATEGLSVSVNDNIRAIAGRNTYYISPDWTNFTMVYDFESGTWRYMDAISAAGVNNAGLYFDHESGFTYMDSTAGGAEIAILEPRTYPGSGDFPFFEFEPAGFRTGPGRTGILRKVWIDVQRGSGGANGTLDMSTIIDGVSTALTSFTPGAGRTVREYNINAPIQEVASLHVIWNDVRDVRVNAIEADIYVPELDE